MKNSVPVPVVIAAIVVVVAIVGFFAVRTIAPPASPSTDLGAKADITKLQNISDKDIQQMKSEMEKARGQRGEATK